MKVLIIEDEKPAQERLKKLIGSIDEASLEIVGVLDSVKASLRWFNENEAPDLILSDIHLADGLSFKIYESIQVKSAIIFCTAFDEYAIKAFKHNSIDYLLKPIDEEEFRSAIQKYLSAQEPKQQIDISALQALIAGRSEAYKKRFMVKLGDKISSIPTENVSFFCSQDKATYLFDQSRKKHLIDYPLDEVESMLDPKYFFRLNRKYICHIDAIQDIYSYSNSRLKVIIQGHDDNDILVSREKVNRLKEWLDD